MMDEISQFVLNLNAPLENLGAILSFIAVSTVLLILSYLLFTFLFCQIFVVPYLYVSNIRMRGKTTLWQKFLRVHEWSANHSADEFTWSSYIGSNLALIFILSGFIRLMYS